DARATRPWRRGCGCRRTSPRRPSPARGRARRPAWPASASRRSERSRGLRGRAGRIGARGLLQLAHAGAGRARDAGHGAARDDGLGLGEREVLRGVGVLIAMLDEQPLAVPHAHQHPRALHLLAVQPHLEVALGECLVHVGALGLPRAAVPDHHRAAAVLALGDHALEVVVVHRVRLGHHREPPDGSSLLKLAFSATSRPSHARNSSASRHAATAFARLGSRATTTRPPSGAGQARSGAARIAAEATAPWSSRRRESASTSRLYRAVEAPASQPGRATNRRMSPLARRVPASMRKPAASTLRSVSRFQWQPPLRRVHSGCQRSCTRALRPPVARTCSSIRSGPPGPRRASGASARGRSTRRARNTRRTARESARARARRYPTAVPVPLLHVDAFTAEPFRGNAAAVCLLPAAREVAWMRGLAAELNLPATAFVVGAHSEFALRWFTPSTELQLCGHGTLAAAHALWETRRLAPDATARFTTGAGALAAARRDGWI